MADLSISHIPLEAMSPQDGDLFEVTIDAPAAPKTRKMKRSTIVAGLATETGLTTHTSDTANPHATTRAQVGLGSVDNTADAAKPVSTATQTALDAKTALSHTHAAAQVTDFQTQVSANADVVATKVVQHSHANKTLLDTYTQTEASLADAVARKHTHANQAALDATTAGYTTVEASKLAGVAPAATLLNRPNHTGTQSADSLTDGTTSKAFLASERTKLTGIATGATANSSDATLLARANHTGSQTTATISDFSTAADARIGAAAGSTLATLSGGKVPTSQLPVLSLTSVQTATSQTAMLALVTQEGDVVVRTDSNQTYMRNAGTAGTMVDFTLLNTPTDAVTSVNAQTGVVVLSKSDIGLSAVPNVDATARASHTGTQSADSLVDGTATKAYAASERTKLAGIAIAATADSTDAQLRDRSTQTGTQSADSLTDGTTNKAFLTAERTKLAGIAAGATANDTDANLKNRVNHTGTQLAATISDFTPQVQALAAATHPENAVIKNDTTYALDRFNIHPERWVHSLGGAHTIADGVMTLTTPAGNDTISTRSLWTAMLQDFDTISFEVNFNGNTLLTAGDTPLLSINQAGDRGIVLTSFATNGLNGWQTISLPLSKFTSSFDATTSTAGTGTHLDPATTVSNLKLRVYENTAGKTLSFRNIVLSDSTSAITQDFTQPSLFAGAKPGSSLWRILVAGHHESHQGQRDGPEHQCLHG